MEKEWTRKDFAQRLRDELKQRNLTVTEFARRTGIPDATLSSYINLTNMGRTPSVEAARKIATALRVPLDYLWPEYPSSAAVYADERLAELGQLIDRINKLTGAGEEAIRPLQKAVDQIIKEGEGRYFACVSITNAKTGSRQSYMVLEVPISVKQPIGLFDPKANTVTIVDFGSGNPPFASITEEGEVRISDDAEGAIGTAIYQFSKVS